MVRQWVLCKIQPAAVEGRAKESSDTCDFNYDFNQEVSNILNVGCVDRDCSQMTDFSPTLLVYAMSDFYGFPSHTHKAMHTFSYLSPESLCLVYLVCFFLQYKPKFNIAWISSKSPVWIYCCKFSLYVSLLLLPQTQACVPWVCVEVRQQQKAKQTQTIQIPSEVLIYSLTSFAGCLSSYAFAKTIPL